MRSRRIQMAAWAALAIVLSWLFLRQVDLAGVAQHVRGADYRWVALSTVLTLLATVQRAWRWHYLLLPIKSIPLAPLVSATFIGWTFTAVLPGRLGEIVRPLLVGRRENISKAAAFATIVLERLCDLLCVLLILVAYLLFFPLPAGLGGEGAALIVRMRWVGVAALCLLAAAVAFLVAAQMLPRRTDALLVQMLRVFPAGIGARLLPIARSFLLGFAGISSPKLIAGIVVSSLLIWGNALVSYWLLLLAFDMALPPYAVMPLLAMVVIGVMVPTPAAVGAFHYAAQLALTSLWGIAAEPAASYAIVCHAVAFGPIALVGVFFLMREGLSLRSVAGSGAFDWGAAN